MWHWSADTLFWQLSVIHNKDVQYRRSTYCDGLMVLVSYFSRHDQTRSNSTIQGVQTVKCLVTKQCLMVFGRQTSLVCPGPWRCLLHIECLVIELIFRYFVAVLTISKLKPFFPTTCKWIWYKCSIYLENLDVSSHRILKQGGCTSRLLNPLLNLKPISKAWHFIQKPCP